jgi:hypothetical protein
VQTVLSIWPLLSYILGNGAVCPCQEALAGTGRSCSQFIYSVQYLWGARGGEMFKECSVMSSLFFEDPT